MPKHRQKNSEQEQEDDDKKALWRRQKKDNRFIRRTFACLSLVLLLIITSSMLLMSADLFHLIPDDDDPTLPTPRTTVALNINGGKAVFDDIIIVPGIGIEKRFFIANLGNCEVYYRVYIDNLRGSMAPVLTATLLTDDGEILHTSPMTDFNKSNITAPLGTLALKEMKNLVFRIYCPQEVTELLGELEFDIKAEGVEKENNPGGLFE